MPFRETLDILNDASTPARWMWIPSLSLVAAQKKVFIILDALDESITRDDVLRWIKDIVSRSELHVQLLCTSRPEPDFLSHIPQLIEEQNCLPLDKEAVDSDIQSWVTTQLAQRHDFTKKSLSQDLIKEIQGRVGDGADGMFRWAFCQLDSLARCSHEAAMEEALASLPQTLNETYQRMIANIPAELQNDAIRLLQFLVHSKRPVKLAEAKEVIATQIKTKARGFSVKRRLFYETDVLKYCPGLLTVVQATNKELHLAHFSVKEYLGEMNGFSNATASVSITKTCLTYLTDINGSHKELEENFPMARYAAEAWTGHAALAQASSDIVAAIVKFLMEEATFQRWLHLFQADVSWKSNSGSPPGSRLYYACFAGLAQPARTIIHNGADVNAKGGRYGNALQAASIEGHQEVVRLLLDKGADINTQGGEYGTALQRDFIGPLSGDLRMTGSFKNGKLGSSSFGIQKTYQEYLGGSMHTWRHQLRDQDSI
ncbi:Putative Pfs, NACHT and Ankyrin domain protein [Aspergillus calidoustus]|uniref:Putative Pfs, NACHT and Ankyrin domain protein n=1 Tax=Aspergillus calidoustus TaxID=454130 RepID=A0A0U5G5G0_ASPCI|nr:Putative Pfs, NACHT and Ankyrin domain protein [Aspergillus calidoustus]